MKAVFFYTKSNCNPEIRYERTKNKPNKSCFFLVRFRGTFWRSKTFNVIKNKQNPMHNTNSQMSLHAFSRVLWNIVPVPDHLSSELRRLLFILLVRMHNLYKPDWCCFKPCYTQNELILWHKGLPTIDETVKTT